ncbi:MAG: O-antigen ligase family protein [Pyrinomonadaceae bacterium]
MFNFSRPKNKNKGSIPYRGLIFFGLTGVILFPLFRVIPDPGTVSGHPWKVELVFSLFLIPILFVALFYNQKLNSKIGLLFEPRQLKILLPFLLFTIWSGISLFWAGSSRSVAHHTLVWAVYLVFFATVYLALTEKKFLRLALQISSAVALIISFSCLVGYVEVILNPAAESAFRVTFSKFSEILALLTPFFLALFLLTKNRLSYFYAITALLCWAAILVSLSRTSFIAAGAGLLALAVILTLFYRKPIFLKKAALILPVFIALAIISQTGFLSVSGDTTLYGRFTSDSDYQVSSNQIRFLLIDVSLSMAGKHPVLGVGADNFGLNINRYRAADSALDLPDEKSGAGEALMLERAHNEFLQILAELGLVGIFLFAFLALACFYSFYQRVRPGQNSERRILLLRFGAMAGLIAFLTSSLASSFSFRAMQNGLVFFLVLAICLAPRRKFKKNPAFKGLYSSAFKPILAFSLTAVFGLSLLAGTAGLSRYHVYLAENETEYSQAEPLLQKAIALDPENGSAFYARGIRLLIEKNPDPAARDFRCAIERGISVSSVYSYLSTAQFLSGNPAEAEKTMNEAVRIFPRSVFARVRYAFFLDRNGQKEEAAKNLEIASQIDPKQTRGWNMLLREGSDRTAARSRVDPEYPELMDLQPTNGLYAVIDEENFSGRFPSRLARNR